MRFVFVPVLITLLSCGGPSEDTTETGGEPIIGGRPDRVHRSVGQIGHARGDSVVWLCTGTLIGSQTVLTAAHCLYGNNDRRVYAPRLRFRSAGRTYKGSRSSVARNYHRNEREQGNWSDAAVIVLDQPVDLRAIPIATHPPEEGEAQVIGFGLTHIIGPREGYGGGERHIGAIELDTIWSGEIGYHFDGTGACFGDSGGPVLQDFGEGEVVVGITSRGDSTCDEFDIATRVDGLIPWIERISRRDVCRANPCL